MYRTIHYPQGAVPRGWHRLSGPLLRRFATKRIQDAQRQKFDQALAFLGQGAPGMSLAQLDEVGSVETVTLLLLSCSVETSLISSLGFSRYDQRRSSN